MEKEPTRYKKLKRGAGSLPVKLKLKKRGIHDWKKYPNINLDQSGGSYRKTLPSNKITTTKYTLINFIPKNIFEQFRRMTNIYFLMIVCITLIPAISPLNPWTSILPLSFVLGVTAIKEGYEDIQRYKEDNKVNNKRYTVIKRDGKEKKKKSQSLKVGDFVKIKSGQFLPADIVPLVSSIPDGVIYIETAQLDGETNLKLYRAPPVTNSLSESEVINLNGHIECEKPTFDLNNWGANLVINGDKHPLTAPNLLLRGAKLKNTDWVIGMVVYSGRFTKLSLNQKLPPSKFSTVESRLNKAVISIFCFKMCLVITCTVGSAVFNNRIAPDAWYLDIDTGPAFQATKDFFSYFALLSFMIPMSLMVTLEVVKVVQGQLMEWDEKMAIDPNNVKETGMKPKTTNLNDELALVKYIFSDKTGTLTENCMEFKKVSVNGVVYDDAFNGELLQDIESGGENSEYVRNFLMCLAICQSAVPDTDKKGRLIYKAQSPDEEALCDGARANGFTFTSRAQTQITVNIQGEDQIFEILKEIEFTSERKKMTVVCRLTDGRIRVYSKGADSAMLEILGKNVDDNIRQKTVEDIDGFSKQGLRTLLICYKDMTEEEYEEWNHVYHEAETYIGDPKDKKKKLADAALLIENGFELIGCSAIEDRLQQMVPETIHNLLRANIKVWVITGDKQETAVNIGYSCKLLKNNMQIITINADSEEGARELLKSACENYCGKKLDHEIAVVIDGATLVHALSPELSPDFLRITSICHSVVCCRVSPLQKALIVRLMKEYTKDVCLSIGDGANDVSMIQEAHIGVGIFGKEGTQAARSADYAIREFRHLIRLLTVHGRYSYIRNVGLIQYSFYKNVAAFLVQFWFAFYSGFSATTIYDDWIVTFFNIFFTSIPPFFYAIFEKDIVEEVINEYPEAYRYVQRGKLFTYSTLTYWMLSAIWCSLVFFYGSAMLLYNEPFYSDGRTTGLRLMGNIASTIAIFTVILKICTISHLWNLIVHLGVWGSMSCYVVVFLIESFLPTIFPTQYYMWVLVVINPNFWGLFLVSLIICLIPDVFFEYLKRQFFPDDWMILQEAHKYRKFEDVKRDLKAVEEIREQKKLELVDDEDKV